MKPGLLSVQSKQGPGARLAECRRALGASVSAVVEVSGVSRKHLARAEGGAMDADFQRIEALAKALGGRLLLLLPNEPQTALDALGAEYRARIEEELGLSVSIVPLFPVPPRSALVRRSGPPVRRVACRECGDPEGGPRTGLCGSCYRHARYAASHNGRPVRRNRRSTAS